MPGPDTRSTRRTTGRKNMDDIPDSKPKPRGNRKGPKVSKSGPDTPEPPTRGDIPTITLAADTPVAATVAYPSSNHVDQPIPDARSGGKRNKPKKSRNNPSTSNPGTPHSSQDSHDKTVSSDLRAQVKEMNRALREATTSSPVLMPQSATNHLNEIFNYLGINVPIASELGLMTLPNIRGYAGNDIEDIINMFSKTDLNKADFTDTIIRLRAVGKTMEAILSTNILVLSTNVITEAQRSEDGPGVSIFLAQLRDPNTLDRVRDIFRNYYWTERKIVNTYLEELETAGSIAHSRHSSSVAHHLPSVVSVPRPTTDPQFAFIPKPVFTHTRQPSHQPEHRTSTGNVSLTEPQQASLQFMSQARAHPLSAGSHGKITARAAFPSRYAWDGNIDKFKSFQSHLEGHYSQVGAGYLFDTAFQAAYMARGTACYVDFLDEVTMPAQIRNDTRALFGAMQSACNTAGIRSILSKYDKQKDGLLAWRDVVAKYKADGNQNVRIQKLENVIGTVYTSKYPGGLNSWLLAYENAFAELAELGYPAWLNDDVCKRRLINNAQNIGLTTTVLERLTHDMDLHETLAMLRSHALRRDHLEKTKAISRANMSSSNQANVDNDHDQRMVQLCKMLQVPVGLFKDASKDMQRWIIDERRRIMKDCNNSPKPKTPESMPNKTSSTAPTSPTAKDSYSKLPNQYAKANNTITDSGFSVADIDEFLANAMHIDDDSDHEDQFDSFVGNTVTCRIRVSSEQARQCMNMVMLKPHCHLTIIDDGADTTVLGKGWHVETRHPIRKANVVGFDRDLAVKRGLPIVSAVTAVDLPDGRVILLRAAEAIYNETSDHTLLSEFQIRDFGVIADTVSRKHGGRQCLGIPVASNLSEPPTREYVPLIMARCLHQFSNRTPTITELETLHPLLLTQDQVPWDPGHFYDDPSDDYVRNRDTWIREDAENERLHAERLAAYQDALDDDNIHYAQSSTSTDVPHTVHSAQATLMHDSDLPQPDLYYYDPSDGLICPAESKVLGESVCLSLHAEYVMSLDHSKLDNTFVPDIVPSDPYTSRLSRATSKKVDLETLRPYFGWRPVDVIRHTLRTTTQLATNVIHYPLRRHLKSRFMQLRHRRLNEVVATDTYFSSIRSLEGYWCAQVFYGCTSRRLDVFGMKDSDGEFPEAYMDFIRQRGIPSALHCDNAKAQQSERVKRIHRDLVIADRHTEPHSPWQNPAERDGVKYLKSHVEILLNRSGAPPTLWFLAAQYLCDIKNVCADELLGYRSPNNVATGETDDISHVLCFYFYEPVLYLDPVAKFPASKEQPGYFVGFATNTGDQLTFKILKEDKKTVISRSVVRPASADVAKRNRRVTFDWPIEEQFDKIDLPPSDVIQTDQTTKPSGDYEDDSPTQDDDVNSNVASRTRSKTKTTGVFHLNQEGSNPSFANQLITLARRLPSIILFTTFFILNYMGNDVFYSAINPTILGDGGTDERASYATFEGYTQNELDRLKYLQALDNENDEEDPDNALWHCEQVVGFRAKTGKKGTQYEVKCQWKDPNKSKSWVDFYALALQDPIPILRYARKHHLLDQRPFKSLSRYCTGDAPSHLARAFKAKTKPSAPKYKFGIQVPQGLKQAYEIDRLNGNTLWADAIKKELEQLSDYQTFRTLQPGEKLSAQFQRIPYHIVFDVKFDLRRKARLVAGGNWTTMEREDIYSGVVGMESMRTGFFLGELNGLSCCAADVGNAYLYSRTREKVYIIAGPEFGPELEGQVLVVYKALYGLRTSAARFHEHLSAQLIALGFKQTKYDHDLWIKDKGDHYEYLATFVDDILLWSKDPMSVMNELKKVYILKGVGIPEYYLGGNVEMLDEHWKSDSVGLAMSARTYIENVIPKFETLFGHEFKKEKTPMIENFHPEIDDSPLCSPDDAARFRSVIGSLNWIITLGRYDVQYATCALSRFNMAPREGHLVAAKRILGYLKVYTKGRIIYDTSYPDHSSFPTEDHPNWGEFYPGASEEIPDNLPEAKGKFVRITVYVDANFAHDLMTRRSVTGILIFLNNTPIRWICKRQKTVESSTYGSELVAARVATELILETRYMLRSLGVNIDGPTLLLGDNMSVVLNTSVPSSVLKKKHCAINYHRVREAIAAKVLRFAKVHTDDNLADVLTKPLGRQPFHRLIKEYLFRSPKSIKDARSTDN